MRTSQAERDEVVDRLRRHAGEGRLEVDELEERVGAALHARTHGQLAAVVADLPPEPQPRSGGSRRPRMAALVPLLWLSVLFIGIWALTGAGYFWPVWPIAGIAFFAFAPSCSGAKRRRHRTSTA